MNVTFLEKQITFHKCGCLKEYSKFFPLRELGFAVIDSMVNGELNSLSGWGIFQLSQITVIVLIQLIDRFIVNAP